MTQHRALFQTEQIAAYARASGDMNPIHLDERFARSVGLPGVIAHGMLQMSIAAVVPIIRLVFGCPVRRNTKWSAASAPTHWRAGQYPHGDLN